MQLKDLMMYTETKKAIKGMREVEKKLCKFFAIIHFNSLLDESLVVITLIIQITFLYCITKFSTFFCVIQEMKFSLLNIYFAFFLLLASESFHVCCFVLLRASKQKEMEKKNFHINHIKRETDSLSRISYRMNKFSLIIFIRG